MERSQMIERMGWIAALGVLSLVPLQAGAEDPTVFHNQKEKVSYGIGVGVARDFKLRGVELDVDSFLKGLKDELSGSKLLMTEKGLDVTMDGYARELRQKKEQAEKVAAEKNKKAGEAFLAANTKKEGVVTLPSGLQYKVLKAGGKGDKPTEADAVQINYRGTLIDGTEIDSSYRKMEPTVFRVAGAIPGLKEAFMLMSPGAKWEIFIPSQLGYGDRSMYRIGPNSALIFDVELLSVAKGVSPKEKPGGNTTTGIEDHSRSTGQTSAQTSSAPQ